MGSPANTPGTPGAPHAPLNVLNLDPRTYDRALDCVHCGLCLPACPTYTENGLEADSPRGRIVLMKALADGKIEPTESVRHHLDLCLDCRACETACPSGVVYHELIEETRERLDTPAKPTLTDRFMQAMFFHLLTRPTRLKLSLLPARLLQRLGLWPIITRLPLPRPLAKMQQMLPAAGPLWPRSLAPHYPPTPTSPPSRSKAQRRSGSPESPPNQTPPKRVALLAGCVGSVLFNDVNRQTVALLQLAGCEVYVPRAQQCCGAIHHHGGNIEAARKMAKANIDAMLEIDGKPIDAIVNNAAGCGAMLKEYDHLLRDDPAYADKAKAFARKTRDITELLVELDLPTPEHAVNRTVAYHDACHLAHGQRVVDPPRRLLASIPGLKLVPLPESTMCCGAAGTYNLTQPEMARQLGERKLRHIKTTGAATCATGNVGCAMQIAGEADRLNTPLEVAHPVTLLHEAHFGKR
ncbi:(Fe-S)-binding protein [Phycisphaerales bacterium AB-hyl4]|uniref:Glycolate oxidase iron-sulfur subunit n=1 Tax=Natronomicrosphaera hydrolytica TaxID=3242702 RepID=A0ABV4U589_9BACT